MTSPLTALLTRRSVSVKDLTAPAPNAEQLEEIVRVATRVPDHGKLTPWRIRILRGEGALKLGDIAATEFAKHNANDVTEAHLNAERQRFARAPLCLAVLSTPVPGTKPVWEQELSAGAVCMNILHAAHAIGFGAKWLTEWVAYDAEILKALGGKDGDKIAGFIYIGSKTSEPEDRARPALADVVSEY
jgi:nitroreductase